jgi:ADP-ribose pyrophosphatase YjhB (NUDIX family)
MPSNIAVPEAAAHAVLVDDRGWVLIVQPSYKKRWNLLGGFVHIGEAPSVAVARELRQELGIEPELEPAVVAWAPHAGADRILFLYVGRLTAEQREQGYSVLTNDVARITPFMRRHIKSTATTPSPCPNCAAAAARSATPARSTTRTTEGSGARSEQARRGSLCPGPASYESVAAVATRAAQRSGFVLSPQYGDRV